MHDSPNPAPSIFRASVCLTAGKWVTEPHWGSLLNHDITTHSGTDWDVPVFTGCNKDSACFRCSLGVEKGWVGGGLRDGCFTRWKFTTGRLLSCMFIRGCVYFAGHRQLLVLYRCVCHPEFIPWPFPRDRENPRGDTSWNSKMNNNGIFLQKEPQSN